MFKAAALDSFAVKTYRYLRLSIVVVVFAVMASVLIERSRAQCWNESISAYFYTPVQSMFVGALLVIGVSLIVIRGATKREDVLLNIAGVFAAIVALVPTARPEPANFCLSLPSRAVTGAPTVDPASNIIDVQRAIDNNILGLAVAGVAAIALVLLMAWIKNRRSPSAEGTPFVVAAGRVRAGAGVWVGAAILIIGLACYFRYRDGFLERAHGGAAVAMFFVVGVVIAINARSRQRVGKSPWLYAGIAAAMAISAVAVVIAKGVADTWNHQILVLEILELSAFAVYWIAQTFEHWDGGITSAIDGVSGAGAEGDKARAS